MYAYVEMRLILLFIAKYLSAERKGVELASFPHSMIAFEIIIKDRLRFGV